MVFRPIFNSFSFLKKGLDKVASNPHTILMKFETTFKFVLMKLAGFIDVLMFFLAYHAWQDGSPWVSVAITFWTILLIILEYPGLPFAKMYIDLYTSKEPPERLSEIEDDK